MKNVKLFEQFTNEAKSINEEAGSYKPGNISIPDTYDIKWTTTDLDLGEGIFAKKYDFEFEMTMEDSAVFGEKIKQTVVMSMSDDSTGVFALGDDVEKFSGIPEEEVKKDVAAGKESENDAIIYGLVNIMNGGKDQYFWTNGTRLSGAAKNVSSMSAVIEQIAHEAGVTLTRLILVKTIAQKLKIDITNEDWVTHDYGSGEYMWPAVGDTGDDKNPIVMIDQETFATAGSAMISMLTDGFFEMASNYLQDLPKLK
jgi:hypothetical protein|tara:strand:+ start:363 stop:1127 length:765 start_codon:yes stop_codon:yes gene_type:complete